MAHTIETMGPELSAQLADCERRIQTVFAEQGRALREIRDHDLWRAGGYRGFVEYCELRWEWGTSHAYRLMDAADVVDRLSPNGGTEAVDVDPPDNERQARELVPIKDDEPRLLKTWRALREEHGHTLTAEHVRDAVRNLVESGKPEPASEPDHSARAKGRVVLTDDKHQQSLYRLAAVGQYLYDSFGSDENRGGLPLLALEKVREAQDAIDEAIKQGQRTRRRCIGGEIKLVERPG